MYNVKLEAIISDINKAKIKAVTAYNNWDPNVKKAVLNYIDYYVAFIDFVYAY